MELTKFWAALIGDTCNVWSVIPSDGFLKQDKATRFAVHFKPNNTGVSAGHFEIEAEVRLTAYFTWDHFYNCADGLPCMRHGKLFGVVGSMSFDPEMNRTCLVPLKIVRKSKVLLCWRLLSMH